MKSEEESDRVKDVIYQKQWEKEKIEKNYPSNEVYNENETGFFYILMPDKTMIFKVENFKAEKKPEQS